MGAEQHQLANLQSQLSTVRWNRRGAISCAIALCFIIICYCSWPHPGATSGNARQYVSTWFDNHDYSPYANVDALANLAQSEQCSVSSLDLYRPTKGPCTSRGRVLKAMSEGGRIGFDAPYQTRDCDMRWYSTPEVCSILSRFNAVHFVGDSMMRHVSNAVMTFLREDLVNGARTTWRDGNPEHRDCTCRGQYDGFVCWREGFAVTGTEEVWKNDPMSIKCPQSGTPDIDFQWSAKDPAPELELDYFKKRVRGGKREAFIFGHGTWDSYEVEPTQRWISDFEGALAQVHVRYQRPMPAAKPALLPEVELTPLHPAKPDKPGLTSVASDAHVIDINTLASSAHSKSIPTAAIAARSDIERRAHTSKDVPARLFLTPNAQGRHKEKSYIATQNNIKLMTFERNITSWLGERGWDTLGAFNLTVQAESKDGTHATMENNLVKAMMVFNWLDWVGRGIEE